MTVRSLVFAVALSLAAGSAAAHDFKVGSIEVDHPWTRATPKGATVGGGYMKITNKGSAPDRLVGGTLEAAGRFEVHEMAVADGVMKMRMLSNGLEIKPGQTVELKPGSFHVMFMGLKQPFEAGKRVKGTLVFEKAGTLAVEYTIEAMGGSSSGHHRGH